jgi:hypothetical protein
VIPYRAGSKNYFNKESQSVSYHKRVTVKDIHGIVMKNELMRVNVLCVVAVLSSMLVACSSTTGPVAIRDSTNIGRASTNRVPMDVFTIDRTIIDRTTIDKTAIDRSIIDSTSIHGSSVNKASADRILLIRKKGADTLATSQESIAFVNPVAPDVKTTTAPIIDRLAEQALRQYKDNDYKKAINTAERGLRINRKEARFYLTLTKAYRSLNNNKQAIFFAQQGLRYAQKNSPVFFELKKMLAG